MGKNELPPPPGLSPLAQHYIFTEADSGKWPLSVQREYSAAIQDAYQEAFNSVPPVTCLKSGWSNWYGPQWGPEGCPCQGCTGARAAQKRAKELTRRY